MTTPNKFKGGPVMDQMEIPRYFSDYVRYVRDATNNRIEKQVNPYKQNDGWYVESAEPGLNLADDFVGIFDLAASNVLLSSLSWGVSETATGAVTPGTLAVNFSAAAENDAGTLTLAGGKFPFTLADEPHVHFKITLNDNDDDFLFELGFEDTAGTTQLLIATETSAWVFNCDDGTGTDTTTDLATAVSTATLDVEFRFGDDGTEGAGSQVEILINGTVVGTFTYTDTLKYPELDTAVNFIARITNGKSGGGTYTADLADFRLCAIK